jgi:hypothetical protein
MYPCEGDRMSQLRKLGTVSLLLAVSCSLAACLGTDAKTLGKKTVGGKGTGATDSESFSITIAYRKDAEPDDGRLVVIQGVRDLASASIASLCGSTGATCQCIFYKSSSDTAPLTSTPPNGLSVGNNSFSCTIPGATDPDLYTKVRLKTNDGTKSTGFLDIKNSLTLEDVIGDLDKAKVRGVHRYSCTRTFFEGEGVSASAVDCPPEQRLGLITAAYTFYIYNSQLGGNMSEKGSNSAYEQPICERQFNKLTCDGTPDLRWGLYAEKTGPFQVAISMTANPEGENATGVYGFAALPDSGGNCPTGLVKIRPWEAQPQSIIAGSIDGTNPPSSFVNQTNNLNDRQVEISQPSGFVVRRQANPNTPATRCAPANSADPAPGSCRNVVFGGSVTQQTVTYTGITPVVCAIPKDLMSGLF